MIAAEGIPAQTVAPKFTGRFNKGVDYVGDLVNSRKSLMRISLVIDNAIMYPFREPQAMFTLGASFLLADHKQVNQKACWPSQGRPPTTWSMIIGLAEADGDALVMAKEIYAAARRWQTTHRTVSHCRRY